MRKWCSRLRERKTILPYLKRAVIISLFFLMGVASAEEGLLIDADNIDYDKEKGFIEAYGSVEATYGDLKVNTPHLFYFISERTISSEGGFLLHRDDQTIDGQSLSYNIDNKSGSAKDVNVSFKGLYLKGKSVRLGSEEITVLDSSFSTCDRSSPHYHITASDMTLYPKSNLLFAYWGWFYLGVLPIVPVPTYVYDLGPEGKRQNMAPIPEIGSNDVDGGYVIEKLGWHSSSQVYGNVSLTYASKKGFGGGIESNYIADDENRYNARIGKWGTDGYFGGAAYTKLFGGDREMRGTLNISSRERINYERVSLLPEVSLELNRDTILGHLKYSGGVKWAKVLEESTTLEVYRSCFFANLSYSLPADYLGVFTFGGDFDYKWYGDSSKWLKIIGTVDLSKKWNDLLSSSVGARHFVLNDGNSPFNFEMYRFRPSDDVYIFPSLDLGWGRFGVNTQYYVPSWDLKDVDYSLTARYHCFDFTVIYRALRDEVRFGISLAKGD